MTEAVSERYQSLDQWSTESAVDAMLEGQMAALAAIKPSSGAIAAAIDAAAGVIGDKGRLIYVGAGTSGRLAVQDGAELTPTFSWPPERTVFCMAGGMDALVTSVEGAEDSADDGVNAIADNNAGPNDVVIAVAASGRTPFTLGALREAKRHGALTIGIAMNAASPIVKEADHGLLAETGGELVAGSTRMKAGTAQKVILNMISTGLMVRLGRVYGGYMVDMIASNRKLVDRAIRMVSEIADCTPDAARKALTQSDNNIKKAILIVKGLDIKEVDVLIAKSAGNLRVALEQMESAE